MSSYSDLTVAIAQQAKTREDALPVQEGCRSKFFFHPQPTKKVIIFFHGFTGGPWQFEPIGQTLFKAGYNVLIPLLPGHGYQGEFNRHNPTPLPTTAKAYQDFALEWLQKAQPLGQQVVVGGLSGGATVAGWLAFERPQQVNKALLFAPFITGKSKIADFVVKISDAYHEWPGRPDPKRPGYHGFVFPALKVFLDMGDNLLKRAERSPAAPMFLLSTELDDSVENGDHENLFKNALKYQSKTWYYRFSPLMGIRHTMMTIQEGNPEQSVRILQTMAKAYIESDISWVEIQEISYRMTKGRMFNDVVAELKLTPRISPDLPALITMIDKRRVVDDRNSIRKN